ncbi:conserved hypothetical protein [Theileria orientalis strain Shintoku]|uniref:Holliday junction resolvase n=1 Tax=Theileria orientalis strain Shintoku TaxID=869250 RepID=J4C3L1_THEOR|nr:conserved hypothetical protein [Theileria orientalis strain Shintoku]BAM40631.1 conserved hypothetical protein [Theileria orientalis strain Shintoku]|eukprot:XP_009690932.1 conserved hypothetical protein [Theileria orientalis strain Shintoku]
MNILPLGFHVILVKALLAHSYRLKHAQLKVSGVPKTVLLKPTISTDRSVFTAVTTASSNGGNSGYSAKARPFRLPNTLSVDSKLDYSWPVLCVDLGTRNVGLSFNYEGQFELFKSIKFLSHRQLTARILGLVNYLKERHLLDRLVVGIGFPFLPPSGSDRSNGLESADLRMLFQIIYTLDYSYSLAHYLDRVFGQKSNTSETSRGDATFSRNRPSKAPDPNNTVTTHCLFCSIFSSAGTPAITSGTGITGTADSDGPHEFSQSRTATHPLCRITGRTCLQTVDLSSMNYVVVGVSEHLSTYQTGSLASPINTTGCGSVNRAEASGTSLAHGKAKQFLNRDSLSSLNIYHNLLESAKSADSNRSDRNTAVGADNTPDDRSESPKGTDNTAVACGPSPFLVLPNRSNIFSAKTKYNNILLFRRIKAHLLSTTFIE